MNRQVVTVVARKIASMIAFLLAASGCLTAQAQEISSGTYSGGAGIAVVDDGLVALTIQAVGCIGELDGRLAQNNLGEWFILGDGLPRCVISLQQHGRFAFSLEQHENCSNYHGAACQFSGYYRRTD